MFFLYFFLYHLGLSYYLTNMKADNSLQQQLSASSAQVADLFLHIHLLTCLLTHPLILTTY